MADASEKVTKKKEREPITWICFIVFLIACIVVLGNYVNENFIQDDKETVEYGDSVDLDYTGSLYDYYDSNGTAIPVIFDTSLKSVADDDSNLFISGFSKTSFSQSTITLGNHTFLTAFENAVMGHKVGDTIRVKIAAADAYPAANDLTYIANNASAPLSFTNGFTVTVSQFNTLFDKNITSFTSGTASYTDVNGLPAKVTYDGSLCKVYYELEAGHAYSISDTEVGKVTLTPIAVGATVTYTLSIEDYKSVSGDVVASTGQTLAQIEMISLNLFGTNYNIIGYTADGGIIYNNATSSSDAIHNMDLYFVIHIVEKN